VALQGNLKDFSITEVIQLIGQQLKTGVLTVERAKELVEIHFVDGMIVHVYCNYRGQRDLIGEILLKAHVISEEGLGRALRIQRETPKYLGEILVELQLASKEEVLKVISTQIYETIYDLFWWEEGKFYFDLKVVEGYRKISFVLSTEQVLLNILRMVDEWSEIEKKVHSVHLVFGHAVGIAGGAGDSMAVQQDYFKEKLVPEQELIYHLVDGNQTVQEIIDRTLMGKFNTCEVLANLLEMGFIREAGVRKPPLMTKMGRIGSRQARGFLPFGGLLLLVILFVVYVRPDLLRAFSAGTVYRFDLARPSGLVHRSEVDRIRNALEVYRAERGTYPSQLEALCSARLLPRRDLSCREGFPYRYEVRDGKYSLRH
jgi:hypothetical protein